ncbi:hypothetical protein PanWU01x14_093180 [Parasponia andersonii]|uniref:Uncharacterized protein n=1 Tax=Parasponia andersonii TaxID=3476 RepID=A0A2P5D5Y0_PARAD|nr:hypothetical protein PanWU01x14_093180 [Parasponia andersonii]
MVRFSGDRSSRPTTDGLLRRLSSASMSFLAENLEIENVYVNGEPVVFEI